MHNTNDGLFSLSVYVDSLKLVGMIYKLCNASELKREFELTNQLKRAALSVSANIAEGYGRKTNKDFSQYISIALGSANEVLAFIDCIHEIFPTQFKPELREFVVVICKKLYKLRLKLISKDNIA